MEYLLDIKDKVSQVEELPGKKWFRKLDEAVIEAGRCVECGGCVAACPSGSIGVAPDGRPTLIKMCTGCSRCWDFCPRAGLRYERLWEAEEGIGKIQAAYTARAKDVIKATNGGVVTTILKTLLENGVIEGALIARESPEQPWKGEAYLATTSREILESSKTFYNQVMTPMLLDHSLSSVAFVGTPCQIQAIKALQKYPWEGSAAWRIDSIKITIALMCTRAFKYEKFAFLLKKKGVDLSCVDRMEVKNGEFTLKNKERKVIYKDKIHNFDAAALPGCDECADFSGRLADISVGGIASEKGYTTVLIRTATGEKVWDIARSYMEYAILEDLEPIVNVEMKKRKRAKRFLKRPFDPRGDINVEVTEHYSAYSSSDRAPKPLNPARVYQYAEVC